MQTKYRVVLISLILLLTPLIVGAKPTEDERLNIGGIVKTIDIPDGQQWAYVTVEAVIDAPIKAVWAALTNLSRWPNWLPMSSKAGFLSPEAESLITPEISRDENQVLAINAAHPDNVKTANSSGHWQRTAYELYNLPWPIENEWVVRVYTYDETPEKNRATWKRIDSKLNDDDGYWEVSPHEKNKTLLKYYYRVKAKENVPKPIFRTAVSFTVNSMIKALRHEVKKNEN